MRSLAYLVAEHASLLVVGGHLGVVAALGAAARAALAEEDEDAVARLGAEGEVEQRVQQRRRVHRPLHHGLVALAVDACSGGRASSSVNQACLPENGRGSCRAYSHWVA